AAGVRAREDAEDGVQVAPELRQVGCEVRVAERRPELLHDLTARVLEGALKATRHLPAEGEVIADHGDLAIAEVVVHPLAEGLRGLGARPSRSHDVRAPLALRDVLRGHNGENRRHLLVGHVAGHRITHRGGEWSHEYVHALALYEAARLGETGGRLALVVLGDELHFAPRDLPA